MVKFGIVGCGNIGKRHAGHLVNMANASLAAVYDIDPQAASAIAEQSGAKSCESLAALLGEELDIVAVCTPNGNHFTTAKAALEAGKNVLIEKPMTILAADAQALLDLAKAKGLQLFVVKQNRFNPPVVAVKELMLGDKLGRIHTVIVNCLWNRNEAYYRSSPWRGTLEEDGGTLFTQFSHFIDILYYLLGDIEPIAASVYNAAHEGIIAFEDTGHFIFRVKGSETVGSFNYTTAAFRENVEGSISILGEKGSVKIGGKYMNTIDYQVSDSFSLDEIPMSNPANNYGFYEGSMSNHDKMLANVVGTLEGKEHIMASAADGVKVVEIIESFYKLVRQN